MKQPIRNGSLGLLAAALLFTTVACSSGETVSTTTSVEATASTATIPGGDAAGNVVDDLISAGNFTVLTELLTATGLVETLSGPGPFTVFAPTDEAFEATAAERGITLDELIGAYSNPAELLKDVLLYHVLPGNIPAADMPALNGKKIETLSGEKWTVVADGQTVNIKDGYNRLVNVIDVDIAASNGVIHSIDRVLEGSMPGYDSDDAASAPTSSEYAPYDKAFDGASSSSVFDDLVTAGSFTVLTELLTTAGLKETLSGPGPFTVFAPTDAAFEAVAAQLGVNLEDLKNTVIADPKLLKEILLYHVVPGSISAADMVALNGEKVETLSGEKFTVIADGQTLSIKDGFGVIVNVIDSGVIASNGVIHVVDTVFHGGGAVR